MTQSPEPEVILEPGDPGYVAPTTEPSTPAEQEQTDVIAPGPNEGLGAPAPAGEDLTHVREARETDAEYLARTRNTVVDSQSPTDLVPNTPQTTMGQRVPAPGQEGLAVGVPPETQAVPPEGETTTEPVVTETPVVTTEASA